MAAYSKGRVAAMLAAVDDAPTADAKGDALEALARYIFEKVAGVVCSGMNILDGPRAHELDLSFWNDQRRSVLFFLDALLVVECKATAAPVGSAEVGWFVRKLQDRGASHGILVALNGITGDGDRAAHNEIRSALMRDRIKILLLTRGEISSLKAPNDLANLLKRKLLRLTLERVVHVDQ